MARTPLFRYLAHSLQLARVANATNRPGDELVELLGQRRSWTRRELLTTTAVAGAGLALGCATSAARPHHKPSETAR